MSTAPFVARTNKVKPRTVGPTQMERRKKKAKKKVSHIMIGIRAVYRRNQKNLTNLFKKKINFQKENPASFLKGSRKKQGK